MADIRRSPTWAHVAPLAAFMLVGALQPLVGVKNEMLPWWRFAPEQWIFPLQTLFAGALLFWFRRHYQLAPWRGLGLAVALGTLGIIWWCLPALVHAQWVAKGGAPPEWMEWLGVAARKEGFDPSFFEHQPIWYPAAIFIRFVRMVVVVPLIEEIFWRGFLMRYLQTDGGDFRKIPFGHHTWRAFAIVTAMFMAAHAPVDWTGALVFGSLMYWLAIRTKSLGACVLMHAVANLLLGLYVMWTRQWGFW
ncbi:MAG: CAAX prenyl protease-related protein [Verrucomicrobium sp.]